MYVEYDSNNSSGRWWLKDEDWKALEAAGWKVAWKSLEYVYTDEGEYVMDDDGTPKLVPAGEGNSKYNIHFDPDRNGEYRFLGALASAAYRTGLTLSEAVNEWERITGESSTEAGCPCCGQPHTFTEYDNNGNYITSGPSVSYEAHW